MGEESPCQGLKEAPEREGLKVLGFKGRVKLQSNPVFWNRLNIFAALP